MTKGGGSQGGSGGEKETRFLRDVGIIQGINYSSSWRT